MILEPVHFYFLTNKTSKNTIMSTMHSVGRCLKIKIFLHNIDVKILEAKILWYQQNENEIIFIDIYNLTVLSRFVFLISFENVIKLQSIWCVK